MQNWNQWQLPAVPSITAPMPQPPIGYAAPGADPLATMQSYMQYYNQPAPSGYTPEQWAAAQQQNWAQWQTWQQQYQQWQAQYGEKYQETMKQMSMPGLPNLGQLPGTSVVQPPPLPKEDFSTKPPLPPEGNAFGFPGIPPPHQNNLPLFPSIKSTNPPLPLGQPPLPLDNLRNTTMNNSPGGKRVASSNVESVSAKKSKVDDEELTEAEKTFDAQFKQWEEQFNKWKQQNANHPDKTQYKQYEAKWTSWREKLIERREQMRRKREQQKQAAAKVEASKDKSLVGDDKILNILSSTENQGLINNLLGIGKTLGLTGKNEVSQGQQSQTAMMQAPTAAMPSTTMRAPTMPPNMNQPAWASQQWAPQYNVGPSMMNYPPGYQQPSAAQNPLPPTMPMPNFNQLPENFSQMSGNFNQPPANFNQPPGNFNQTSGNFNQPSGNFNQPSGNFNQPPGNFNQPPPGMLGAAPNFSSGPLNTSAGAPNFSKPPPGFGRSNPQQTNTASDQTSGLGNSQDPNTRSFRSDAEQKQSSMADASCRGSMDSGNDRFNFEANRFTGPPPNNFGGTNPSSQFGPNDHRGSDGSNKDFTLGHQMGLRNNDNRRDNSGQDRSPAGGRSSNEFRSGDRFASVFDRDQDDNRFNRDSDKQACLGDNRSKSEHDSFNPDRFGSNNDRFNTRNDSFNANNDRNAPNNDRFGSNNDRVVSCNEPFGSNNDRLASNNDRFISNNDRFSSNKDRFSSNNDHFGSDSDRFTSGNDQTDFDNDRFRSRNDQFGSASGDRFGSSVDRTGMGSVSQSNDKFSRPPPDRFDLRDNGRDSGGSNFRTSVKNNQFNPPSDIPPELQKLMEKRRAAMDVFKPSNFISFLDSNQKSDTGTSLSESFRKLTGDAPFLSRSSVGLSKDASFESRGSMPPGSGSDIFECSREVRLDNTFKPRSSGDFRPQGAGGDFRPQGAGGDFRPQGAGGDFRPQGAGGDFRPQGAGGEFRPQGAGGEFRPQGAGGDFRPQGAGGDFRPQGAAGDFRSRGNEFSPRDSGNFGARNRDFGSRDSRNFCPPGNEFGLQQSDGSIGCAKIFGNFESRTDEFGQRSDKEGDGPTENEQGKQKGEEFGSTDKEMPTSEKSERVLGSPMRVRPTTNSIDDVQQNVKQCQPQPDTIKSSNDATLENVPPLQAPPWMESDFADDDIIEIPANQPAGETNPPLTDPSKEDNGASLNSDASRSVAEKSKDRRPDTQIKPDVLPFMGENDPKPEDLNMEPPPELPNLGLVTTDSGMRMESRETNINEPFDRASGSANRQVNFDAPFAQPGMPVKPRDPTLFGSTGPDDTRPPPFGPRDTDRDPTENMRPPAGAFDSQTSNDGLPFTPSGPQPDSLKSRGPFGTAGPGDFVSREPSDFGPRGPSVFGLRGPGDFGPRGLADFGPRGPSDFGPRSPGDFGLRGPGNFGPRGPGNFGPRGEFGPRGPNDFGPRGPSFLGPRGPGNFGTCGPGDFGSRGTSDFAPRGSSDFGPRGPPNFGPRDPSNFGPGGPSNFGPSGPSDFGPRSPSDHGPRGPFEFGSRGASDFGARGSSELGPRAPDSESRGPFDVAPRNLNEKAIVPRSTSPFGPRGIQDRPAIGSNTFGPRGNADNPGTSIPSLMTFKFGRPTNSPDEMPTQRSKGQDGNRWGDLPPAFRKGDQDGRAFTGDEPREHCHPMDEDAGPSVGRGPDWRESFGRNQFGDSDQRSGPPNCPDTTATRSGNQLPINRDGGSAGSVRQERDAFVPDAKIRDIDKNVNSVGPPTTRPSLGESSEGGNNDRSDRLNFVTRHSNEGGRNEDSKEFCAEKQYNYNHSGVKPDDISKEHLPGNVIDYAHTSRVVVDDYVTPAQCFDYDHGKLKPVVPDHEIYSKRDFRNWIENEQNLREYTDCMRIYESDVRALKGSSEKRQADMSVQFRERDRTQDDGRSYDRERRPFVNYNHRNRTERDDDDHRQRVRRRDGREGGRNERDREWERAAANKQREDRSQHRRSRSKDRARERPEKIRKETSKENNKDDERSKGSVADSESSAKKPDEPTSPDNSKQESKNGESEATQKIVDVAKSAEAPNAMEPPTTMELPKTPNFMMVDDLLCPPGRQNRPPKIVVILRGPPGSGKSFVAKLIKDKEVEQGGSAPRILSLDDYFLTEKEIETEENNGKKTMTKEMVYEYEEAMEPSYIASLVKAFKKNITDGFFNFIILDSINEKISDYEDMWSFAKTKGFRVYVCEMEMDVQICLKRNIHNRTEDEINRIVDYFEPTPGYHQKLDVTSMLQEEAIEEVHMEDTEDEPRKPEPANEDSQDSQEDPRTTAGVSKWERMEAEDKLDRLDGLAKRKNEGKPQTMEDFLQVPDYYNMEDTSGKRRVRWADLEERKKQEKMRAVGFVVGQTNWDRMMDPTNGGSALTRTKYI